MSPCASNTYTGGTDHAEPIDVFNPRALRTFNRELAGDGPRTTQACVGRLQPDQQPDLGDRRSGNSCRSLGVTPEIISINASPTVLQALLANEIDAASISVTTLTSSRLAGPIP